MANIKDVARVAGVSPTAVSFVLNGRYDQLSEKTVQRITEAIQTLDYRPSAVAKSLITGRSNTIGVLVTHLRHPIQTFTVSALASEARRHNYNVLIWDQILHLTDPADLSRMVSDELEAMLSHNIAGLIASTPLSAAHLARLEQAHVPVVAYDQSITHLDSVRADWEYGAYLAAAHLARLGRRRLVYLNWSRAANINGIKRALLEYPQLQLAYHATVRSAQEAYSHTLAAVAADRSCDAVFVASDLHAIGVYRALEALNRQIPGDMAVVGFDDTFSAFMSPALTSVSQPVGKMGRTAFRLLLKRIQGDDSPPQEIHLMPQLRIRESCGAPQPPTKAELIQGVWERDTESIDSD